MTQANSELSCSAPFHHPLSEPLTAHLEALPMHEAVLTPDSLSPACGGCAGTRVSPYWPCCPPHTEVSAVSRVGHQQQPRHVAVLGDADRLLRWSPSPEPGAGRLGELPPTPTSLLPPPPARLPQRAPRTVLWEDVFLPPLYLTRLLPDRFHTVNIILPSFWEKRG